jgi:hypothetical protein
MPAHVRVLSSSHICACPKMSLLPMHYRENGSCRCDERDAATQAVAVAKADVARARKVLRAAERWRDKT